MKTLAINDKAPSFKGIDQNGKTVSLSDFKGQKLILYFYPKDDTPGCTAEACNLNDNYALLLKKGFAIVGVSKDDQKSHLKFVKKFGLKFSLIADTDQKIIDAYGVWGEKILFGREYMGILRTTFVINEKGKVEKIFDKVNTKDHTEQILAEY